jgi:hypothetical protein
MDYLLFLFVGGSGRVLLWLTVLGFGEDGI